MLIHKNLEKSRDLQSGDFKIMSLKIKITTLAAVFLTGCSTGIPIVTPAVDLGVRALYVPLDAAAWMVGAETPDDRSATEARMEKQVEIDALLREVNVRDANISKLSSDISSSRATTTQLQNQVGQLSQERQAFQNAIARIQRIDPCLEVSVTPNGAIARRKSGAGC